VRLELRDVGKVFPGPPALELLRGVSLVAGSGESLAITGPSGSGKSTLLNIAGCLDLPTSGEVLVDGRDLAVLSPRDRALVRAQGIGFVFQLHHLLPQCSVLENVLLPIAALPSLGREARRRREERARSLVQRVGLGDRADARPGTLSGGECQRAAVVRALVNEPGMVLADEPTGSLDLETAAIVADLLFSLAREEGVLLVMVTHSEELAARSARRARLAAGVLA